MLGLREKVRVCQKRSPGAHWRPGGDTGTRLRIRRVYVVQLCRGKWKIMSVADASHEDSSKDTNTEV